MKKAFTIILVFLTGNIHTQVLEKELKEKLDVQTSEYADNSSPGIAVGIVQDRQIVYEKYIGLSNLENNIKINENARFNIASNAKQFTALCVLKLIHEGKINLEDDIRIYLPELYKNQNWVITVENLLTHSSGIRDVYDLWALKGQTWWKLFIDNGDAIELIKSQKDLNFLPGTKYLYSNSNYILLTEIVKEVSDKNFAEFCSTLFNELGMEQTAFLTNYMSVIPNKARPYGNWNGWKEYPFITETHGDGALFTTLNDQLKWEVAIQENDGNTIPKSIISQGQLPISTSKITGYGYGLMFGEYKGLKYSYHDGSTGAYNATFMRFPTKNASIVVISNNDNVPTNYLAKQLIDIYFSLQNTEVPLFPAGPDKVGELISIEDIIGNYKTEKGTIIKIVEKKGELYREIYKRDPVKLINEKGNLFHYENNEDLKIAFAKTKDGQWKFTIYLSSQEPNIASRIPTYKLDTDYFGSLNGTYFNDETNTEIKINHLEGNTYSIVKNGRERNGELIVKDFLRMSSYEIKISRNNEEKINGLIIKNNRIENVRFIKR